MALERIIRDSLMCFIQSHIPAADLSGMDDVVFSYIASVLEELSSPEPSEENFDMDTFVEMMEAFVPGFAEIDSGSVCEMMFALSARLSEARRRERVCQTAVESASRAPAEELEQSKEQRAGASEEAAEGAVAQVDLLLEMFPACTLQQAQTALAMALGSLDEAVQFLVEEKTGPGAAPVKVGAWQQGWGPEGAMQQGITPAATQVLTSGRGCGDLHAPRPPQKPSQQLLPLCTAAFAGLVCFRYMMVDSAEDQKTHSPVPPKEAPKKLIRYIDNQVVSTRGERYTDLKKPESEEMKKTYISLKPARKYKFH
nr:CUE domain-containing protein 2 [Pelodiscus sinensis]|eukprot:XP_014425557.1 CUE domain-containing protein 2 [Pelodiscus sinensis]